ncbi:coiled-coil domain containing 88A [Chanos chanos]|uniref:Coiled-coil domain containing 88A n=1 Tax=Chanos chanos TaxID=29144 RepID=A0A6J2UN10_CHACN|nr:girdin-like [Chanos chanos]
MDANFAEMLEEFMGSPLVTWVRLFRSIVDGEGVQSLSQQYMEVNSNSQSTLKQYLELTNGVFLNEVMRIIDPNPKVEHLYRDVSDDDMRRVQNFSTLNRHLRSYYQENLQQLILMPLPNVAILGRDPLTEAAVEELRRLLLLLLGCAVQCERKETFIQQIQSLDIEMQAGIATCIQKVTQDPSAVLPLQYGELCGLEGEELQSLFCSMARQIQSLLAQRDTHLERIAELSQECELSQSHTTHSGGFGDGAPEGLAVQLADSKAKIRRLKQELEDKGDQLLDYKQEIQTMEEELKKLQRENRTLQGEARASRAIRDELDCLRERAAKAEQLQTELKNCTHRLRNLELYRTQLKEQQQYCATLQENRTLLEEQLADARARCSALRELERDNLLLRQKIMDLEGERDTERQRVDELLEYNMSLQVKLKSETNMPETITHSMAQELLQAQVESDEELSAETDLKPLSVEVDEASTLRLLGAENENAELRRRLERLQAEQEEKEELQKQADRLACLEEEYQSTLTELQNMRNENSKLKKSLEELKKTHQLKNIEEKRSTIEEKGNERQVIQRGEGEGKDIIKEERLSEKEKEKDIIRHPREDAEGEEVVCKEKKDETGNEGEIKIKTKERGEAEGEKETKREGESTHERSVKDEKTTVAERPIKEEKNEDGGVKQMEEDLNLPLTAQLHQALEEADRQATLTQELRTKLGEQSKKALEAEQRLVLLETETQRLRKTAESLVEARKQIEILQCESMQQEEELTRLRSQVELHKMEAVVMRQLEGERTALERERETLKATVDSLRAAVRKGDQLEFTNQTLKAELERLGRSLESARRREEELEVELKEAATEAETLSKGRDQALLEVTRLEQEKEACQIDLDSQRREQRQREKEMARLRQQLESTNSALEHGNKRAYTLEAEHRRVCQELSQLKETCSQLEEQVKENQQLNTLNIESKAQINSLTQDLANERIRSQELSNQIAQLSQELEALEAKLKMATPLSPQPAEQAKERPEVKSVSTSTDTGVMEDSHPEKKSPLQRGTSKESSEAHISCQHQITDGQSPALPESVCTSQSPAETGNNKQTHPETSIAEKEPHNERVFNMEKEIAALQREKEVALSQLSQSQSACDLLREQLDTLQRQSISLQENCTKLQALNTKLQLEHASLSSQHASVWARCSESEARCAALEAEAKVWTKEREESAARMESLRRDHDRLTALQQRQETELEELLAKHSQLKSNSRSMEAQHKELEGRYQELLERRTQLEEGEKTMQEEREKIERYEAEQAEREKELERLRKDNERFQALQKEWVQVQSELLAQGSVLRGELSAAQLERTRLEGQLSTLKEQNQHLDLNNVRLTSQYQLLTQLKGNLEEENRHLVEQNQNLARENRALLERSLESRDQHHLQQREYMDKLNELRREKQKLLEKLMDQYRVLEPGMPTPNKAKKTNWIADRMKKLIKPRGVREGKVHFIAAGSIENLADASDDSPSSPAPQQDPKSAPVSPTPLRRVSSQPESDEPPKSASRSTRRKLGSSRHGWGLGRGRGGLASQSFSPGDNRTQPRVRLRSAHNALWEAESSPTPSQDSLSEEGTAESEENLATDHHSDLSRVSSGAEGQ